MGKCMDSCGEGIFVRLCCVWMDGEWKGIFWGLSCGGMVRFFFFFLLEEEMRIEENDIISQSIQFTIVKI